MARRRAVGREGHHSLLSAAAATGQDGAQQLEPAMADGATQAICPSQGPFLNSQNVTSSNP